MLPFRPRITLRTLFVPQRPRPLASRGIKSKTAGRKCRPINKGGSNLFEVFSAYVTQKSSPALTEPGSALAGIEERRGFQSVFEAQKPSGNVQLHHKSPALVNQKELSATPKFKTKGPGKLSLQVRRGRGHQKYEATRAEIRSSYGQPIAAIAFTNSAISLPRIDSKAGFDFIASFTVDAAQSVYIPGEPPQLLPLAASVVTLSEPSSEQPIPILYNFPNALFASVRHLSPNFRFGTLDVFTSPTHLLDILRGRTAFIATMLPGGPMLLRVTSLSEIDSAHQEAGRPRSLGRGQDFEEALTRPSTILPSRHYRAIRYMFGSLSMGIINEIDAWDPRQSHESGCAPFQSSATCREPKDGFLFSGRLFNNSELVEIKSMKRPSRGSMDSRSQIMIRRAWFSRLERVCLGVIEPKDGSIWIQDRAIDLSKWEMQHQLELQRAHTFVRELKAEFAKTSTGIVLGLPQNKGKTSYWELYEVNSDRPVFTRAMELAKGMVEYDADKTRAV